MVGGVIGSGTMMRQKVNMKFPRKVESDRYFGRLMDCMVCRLQRYILG